MQVNKWFKNARYIALKTRKVNMYSLYFKLLALFLVLILGFPFFFFFLYVKSNILTKKRRERNKTAAKYTGHILTTKQKK